MQQPPIAAPSRFLTIAQLVVGILGVLFSLGALIVCLVFLISPMQSAGTGADSAQLLNILFVILAVILLTIPAVVSAIRSLAGSRRGRSIPHKFLVATLALLLVPLILWLDGQQNASLPATALSAITNVLTILIPIWWFLELGRLKLTDNNAKRQWGLFSFSTYITLPLIMLVELVVLGFALLFAALWLVQQPGFSTLLPKLGDPMALDPALLDRFSNDIALLLLRPGVIAFLAAGVVLVIPLIEELLKPLGVWLLHKRGLTPAEGFTLGLICGAAFALLESLFSISAVMPGERLFVITGRLGTGLLHIFTAGLTGWSLASTWRDSKYLRVALAYTISVLLHGAWNFFALLMGLHSLGDLMPRIISPALSGAAEWVLVGLAILLLSALIGFNLYLRRKTSPPPLPEITESGLG
jgi:hypothetical protein